MGQVDHEVGVEGGEGVALARLVVDGVVRFVGCETAQLEADGPEVAVVAAEHHLGGYAVHVGFAEVGEGEG